jgi:hypothetical protein
MRNLVFLLVLPLLVAVTACAGARGSLAAQGAPAAASVSPVIVPLPPAAPADVESLEAIVGALYDVISGPRGQRRDWNRMRSLFLPGGRLMAVGPRQAGGYAIRTMEVNDYIALSGEQLEAVGFREHEIARQVERFGNIAHVFSTYEAFREDETQPFMRGINSIQAMFDGTRWWIVSVYWEAERPDNPIPERYLPAGSR